MTESAIRAISTKGLNYRIVRPHCSVEQLPNLSSPNTPRPGPCPQAEEVSFETSYEVCWEAFIDDSAFPGQKRPL